MVGTKIVPPGAMVVPPGPRAFGSAARADTHRVSWWAIRLFDGPDQSILRHAGPVTTTTEPAGGQSRDPRGATEAAFVELATGLSRLHPDDLPELVRRCAGLLGGHDAVLLLVDLEQRALHPLHDETVGRFDVDAADPGPGSAFRTESILGLPVDGCGDVQLWIPLMDSAERLGVIGVVVPPDRADRELWTAFASLVGEALVSKAAYGDAIARTRRTRPVSLAAELRWSILPPLTFTSDQIEISGILEPAYDIAGDTFDYAINGSRVDLAVLDAMGHGLEASQIANLAVGQYRRSRREGATLGEMLGHIDQVIAEQFGDSRFVTGQLATLDLETSRLAVINAGHPRPLLFRGGLDQGDLDCRPCPPMGLGLVTTEESVHHFAPGEAVLFYTDGITEARSPSGAEFGRDRVARAVERSLQHHDRPSEVLRRLLLALADHSAAPLRDDASAILLRRP